MKARVYLSPLDQPLGVEEITVPTRLLDLFPRALEADVVEWFADGGVIRLDGHIIPPDRWHAIILKPAPGACLDLVCVPSGKKSFAILATVALIALTTAISGGLLGPAAAGTIGLGIFGSAFAAGGLGATLAAAAVGLAGSLAVSALTAPPKAGNQGKADNQLAQAGVSGNTIAILERLPVVLGGPIGYSPPYLAPPYTVWDGDDVIVYAVVGLQGRCLIENIRVNGLPIADIAGASYETREGVPGADPRSMFTQTVIEERDGITLSAFKTDLVSTKNDRLADQADPDASSPEWHTFRSAGTWSELVFRFMFPAGIVYTSTSTAACVALEMEVRKVGDVAWRRLPVFYVSDQKAGSGPMRCEVRLKREKLSAGRHYSYAGSEYPIFGVDNEMAADQTFTRLADDYFGVGDAGATDILPTMTAATTSGVTFSASTEKAGANAAWKARDGSGNTTYWSPNDNTLPGAWLKIDLGSAQTIHSYQFGYDTASDPDAPTTAATAWQLAGSNDDSTWTDIDDPIDLGDSAHPFDTFQISAQASYRYYRWTFTANNGAANTELRLGHITLHTTDDPGTSLVSFGAYGAGRQITRSGSILCQYATLDEKGAILYLDPDQWEAGEYEIRARRGWAFRYSLFDLSTQEYDGNVNRGYFLDYQLSSGIYKIYAGQKNYRSDMTVECFQTIDTESPFDDTGIAMIAVAAPNIQISSVYAEFTRYAPPWDGTIWNATEVATGNPAACYRQELIGGANDDPVVGEAVPDDELADWHETCTAQGYTVAAVLQGSRIGDAKQIIATAGYAAPRDAETYGIVEDKDTSAEPIRVLLGPMNSTNEGTTAELPRLPDAIRAEFYDASQSFAVEHVIVYRDGVDATTAKIYETISYPGFTDQTKVEARARFDLKQAHLRQVRYARRAGLDCAHVRRGMLVGITDSTLDDNRDAGWITAIAVNGSGNVTSITLDNLMPFAAASDFENVEDLSAITDLASVSVAMGVAIRIPGDDVLLKQVTNISDSNVCTFTTPFPLVGSGLEGCLDVDGNVTGGGYLVAVGAWGAITRRAKVVSVVPSGFNERLIVAVDEALDLFT